MHLTRSEMGFGFSLFFVFILVPITGILLLTWLFTRKKVIGKILALVWIGILGLILSISIIHFLTGKKELDREDVYGEYIIDRSKFPGKQADWQYDHFRFEITRQNQFQFHLTDKEKIVKTYKGKVTFLESYARPRIVVHVDTPAHHIIEERPTLFRTVWGFYYVFNSPRYGNVFFIKGKWKEEN
jgi:hypothetical protein